MVVATACGGNVSSGMLHLNTCSCKLCCIWLPSLFPYLGIILSDQREGTAKTGDDELLWKQGIPGRGGAGRPTNAVPGNSEPAKA